MSRRLFVVLGVACALAQAGVARAEGDPELGTVLVALDEETRALLARPVSLEPVRSEDYVEETLARAELALRLRDYDDAATELSWLVEHHPEHRAHADALSLLGEALYRSHADRAATEHLATLLSRGGEPAYRPYVDVALERLVDIAIRGRRFDAVEGYLAARAAVSDEGAPAALAYQRGRYLYHRAIEPQSAPRTGAPALPTVQDEASLVDAVAALEVVPEASPYYGRARYLVGVVEALGGRYDRSIEALRQALTVDGGPIDRETRELARISLARVRYEAGELRDALATYASVPPSSPEYASALYESAWVHARRRAFEEADRALVAFLAVAPDDARALDAELLRGQLLVQAERYDEADAHFEALRARIEPLRLEVEVLPAQVPDLRAYVLPRVRQRLDDLDAVALLPASLRRVVPPYAGLERAAAVLHALASTRRDVEGIDALLARLRDVLEAPYPIHAFADLREEQQRLEGLVNRLAQLRQRLADEAVPATAGPARQARQALDADIAALPTDARGLALRDASLHEAYAGLAATLPALRAEILEIQARVAGAEHAFARDTQASEAPAALEELRASVTALQTRLRALTRGLEAGRVAIGPADARAGADAELRARFAALVAEERAAAGAATQTDAALLRVDALEASLAGRRAELEAATTARVARLAAAVGEESAKLPAYVEALGRLSAEATEVGTDAIVHGYQLARQRLYDLALRADLGHVDVGWSRHRRSERELESLTRQRTREVGGVDRLRRSLLDRPLAGEGAP